MKLINQTCKNDCQVSKIQLDSIVDFKKYGKARISLQSFVPIQPKTSNIVPKFCRSAVVSLRQFKHRGPRGRLAPRDARGRWAPRDARVVGRACCHSDRLEGAHRRGGVAHPAQHHLRDDRGLLDVVDFQTLEVRIAVIPGSAMK